MRTIKPRRQRYPISSLAFCSLRARHCTQNQLLKATFIGASSIASIILLVKGRSYCVCLSPLFRSKLWYFPNAVGKLPSFQFNLPFSAIALANAGPLTAKAALIKVDWMFPTTLVTTVEAERKGCRWFNLNNHTFKGFTLMIRCHLGIAVPTTLLLWPRVWGHWGKDQRWW